MANKSLFRSLFGRLLPWTDARNSEGAPAFAFTPRHALAQYAATGCLNRTFYASAEEQLEKVIELADSVDVELVARTALYAREAGQMKDMPALLCAVLSMKSPALLERVFDRVIDNGKMLRNFVQIVRSGAVARKSLGSLPKKLVRRWLERHSDAAIFAASVGNDPSLADVIKMVHPKPGSKAREALYGYILGREVSIEALPEIVKEYEMFKKNPHLQAPDVPFQMLTSLPLSAERWAEIARNGSWQMVRMNLNTFARQGAFALNGVEAAVAGKLSDRALIRKAKAFPYQLLVAYTHARPEVPAAVKNALQDAMEAAIDNVPVVNGKLYVCPDVSGSMSSPITGHRKGSSSSVRCIDVAALVAAAVVRKNPAAEVLPFEADVVDLAINPRDSVMTNATRLASIGGGGTSTSAPLRRLNKRRAVGDLVILVSDNESWVDARGGRGTATLAQWNVYKERNPSARLVCLDLQPNRTTQAPDREDILNVGGFSDHVFELIAEFAAGRLSSGHWLEVVESVELPPAAFASKAS